MSLLLVLTLLHPSGQNQNYGKKSDICKRVRAFLIKLLIKSKSFGGIFSLYNVGIKKAGLFLGLDLKRWPCKLKGIKVFPMNFCYNPPQLHPYLNVLQQTPNILLQTNSLNEEK